MVFHPDGRTLFAGLADSLKVQNVVITRFYSKAAPETEQIFNFSCQYVVGVFMGACYMPRCC